MSSSRWTEGGKTQGSHCSAVRCSVARGPMFFKWEMLRESWPYAPMKSACPA